MSALDAPAAAATAADMDIKPPDQRPHRRQVLLILGGDVRVLDGTAAGGTRVRQPHLVGGIDHGRYRAAPLPAICAPRFASRPARLRPRRALGKWRRLPTPRTARGLQFVAESLVLAAESLDLTPERLVFFLDVLRPLAQGVDRCWRCELGFGRLLIRHRSGSLLYTIRREMSSASTTREFWINSLPSRLRGAELGRAR